MVRVIGARLQGWRDTAGMDEIDIAEEPADSPDVRWCFEQYVDELAVQFGYEPDRALPLDVAEITRPRGLVLVVRDGGSTVGCGALRLIDDGIGEIKRMWVAPGARGRGHGRRILEALEEAAMAEGRTSTRLETNEQLQAALAMYRSRGYREVEPFNTEPFATHWLVKQLR
jgi:ribosomal protein S18 acetylase RimI-like enzyme